MSATYAQVLTDKRKNAEAEARAVIDLAEAEKRELTAEEDQKLTNIWGHMDSLRSQIEKLLKQEEDQRSLDEALVRAGHNGEEQRRVESATITAEFRKLWLRQVEHVDIPQTHRSADAVREEMRALSKGTATAGGNTVKTTFVEKLYEHMIETATLLRGGATIWNTNSGENIDMPVTTSHGTAGLVAEAGTIPQADPAFGKRSLGAYKYGDLILVPSELLTDTSVNLDGYLSRMAGRAVGNALGAHLITGTGSSQPAGISGSTTLGVTGSTGVGGAPNFDNLIDLFYSVIGPYRNSPDAGWLIKDTTAGALRKLKDSSGRYLWESSVTAGTPDTILSRPVMTDPNMPAVGVTNKSVIFGDLSTYYVRLVNGVRFERSVDFKFDTDVVAFRCLIRGDGVLLDQSGAVKHFLGAAT
jgi:HK97 family phage major capsid protein